MTINTQVRTAGPFAGNGVATAFPFEFKVFSGADLLVFRTVGEGAPVGLTLDFDYSVSLNVDQNANPGGTINLLFGPLAVGSTLDVTSSVEAIQPTELTNQGGFYPKVIENALDRLTILFQQLGFQSVGSGLYSLRQVVRYQELQGGGPLPVLARRRNKLLGFDDNGDPAAVAPISDSAQEVRIDLAKPDGGAGVGFVQSISGAVNRNLESKAREALSAYDAAGADGTGATDNTALLNSLAQQSGLRPIDLVGGTFTSTGLFNPRGRRFVNGVIQKLDSHGGLIQLNTYADGDDKEFIGAEYLYRVFNRIKQGGFLTAFIYGDSTVATAANGGGYAGANFTPDVLMPEFLVRKKGIRNNLSFTNRGVGGTRVAQMNAIPDIDTVGGSTDLFIIKYGINDAQDGFAGFAANLDSKLAEIRANPFGTVQNLSIVLVGPNSTYDPGHGRSSTWYEQLRGIYVAAARKHKCAYFDTYAYMLDVDWTAGEMMDDPFLDGQTVHPTELMQVRIWGKLVDHMFPGSELIPYTSDAWRPLIPLNGWTAYGGNFEQPGASMSIDGWVSLRGLVKGGAVGSGQAIAQLPDPVMYPYAIAMAVVTTSTGVCSIRINTNGNIEQQDGNASADFTSLNGLRFKPRG